MTSDLSALIARLEAAEAKDAWVHAPDVHLALFESSLSKAAKCPPYTTSLDAALALAERLWVEPNVSVLRDRQSAPGWSASVRLGQPYQSVFAPTPALALCIAILRAIPNGHAAEGVVSPNLNPKAQGEVG